MTADAETPTRSDTANGTLDFCADCHQRFLISDRRLILGARAFHASQCRPMPMTSPTHSLVERLTPERRAREFVETGFRNLGVPSLEPYIAIIAKLLEEQVADTRVEQAAEITRLTELAGKASVPEGRKLTSDERELFDRSLDVAVQLALSEHEQHKGLGQIIAGLAAIINRRLSASVPPEGRATSDRMHDSAYVAGAQAGYRCGLAADHDGLQAIINARTPYSPQTDAKPIADQIELAAARHVLDTTRVPPEGQDAWRGIESAEK